jgi:predicted nucleic acid-binding Zn ribbon protein
MSRRAPRTLSNALERLNTTLAPATTLARVQAAWEGATGPAIAAAARPTAERDGVVTVLCEASVWAHELELMSAQLVERLNATLGEQAIRELRCRTG